MPLWCEFFTLWCSSEAVQNFFRQDVEMKSSATASTTDTDFAYTLFFFLRSLCWKLVGNSFCLVHTEGSTCCSLMGIPGFSSILFLCICWGRKNWNLCLQQWTLTIRNYSTFQENEESMWSTEQAAYNKGRSCATNTKLKFNSLNLIQMKYCPSKAFLALYILLSFWL